MLEERNGRPSWVLKREFEKSNLFDPDWWPYIEGNEHRWVRALNSSQCFAVNLIAPLADDPGLARSVWPILSPHRPLQDGDEVKVEFEYTPDGARDWLGERGHQTQVDVAVIVSRRGNLVGELLIEVKYTEPGFGSCRGAKDMQADGKGNPDAARCLDLARILAIPDGRCWSAEIEGRRYWEIMTGRGSSFSFGSLPEGPPCPFRGGPYQLMRNRALADAIVANTEAEWADVAVSSILATT